MHFYDILRVSFLNTLRGKTRSMLTAMSIMIGVASVILVSTIGSSGERIIVDEIEKFGLDGISVYQGSGNSKAIYASDAQLLKNRFNTITETMPFVAQYGSYKINKTNTSAVLIGIGSNSDKIYNISTLHGRLPNESDIERKRKIAIVDAEFAKKSYHRENIVGKNIELSINGISDKYTIVGIIQAQKDGFNQILGGNLPDIVYVPYSTLNKQRNGEELSQIAIKCSVSTDGDEFAQYLSRIKGCEKDGYVAQNLSSKIGEVKSITGIVSVIMSAVAAIALCVAGLGVMNTMFSSTKERASEIGICMAIGAKSRDVMICFVTESVIIALVGGTVGVAIGISLISAVSKILNFNLIYSTRTFLIAEIVSIICGGLFSLIPAAKASWTEPITALKRNG